MMETIVIDLPTEWRIEVSELEVFVYLRITDMARDDKQYIGVFMPKEQALELATALLAAAGVRPVITTRGITSADFAAAGESGVKHD